MTKKVGALTGTLQEQLEGLQALQAEFEACTKLNEVYESATKLEEAGIVDNPHTPESYHSLFAVWDALEKVRALVAGCAACARAAHPRSCFA